MTPENHVNVLSKVVQEFPKQSDVREVIEDDVEKSAVEWIEYELGRRQGIIDSEPDGMVKESMYANLFLNLFSEAKEMELKAKETLYTEEQVREAIEYCKSNRAFDYNSDEIIQSIKQPKKD